MEQTSRRNRDIVPRLDVTATTLHPIGHLARARRFMDMDMDLDLERSLSKKEKLAPSPGR
jgi:hypothetical protein